MPRLQFTATQKIAGSFLLNAAFSLIAILYALNSMRAQNASIEALVSAELRALSMVRDLRENLLAQDRLEKQYGVLREPDLLDLLQRRQHEFDSAWTQLVDLPLSPALDPTLREHVARYLARRADAAGEPPADLVSATAESLPRARARSSLLHQLDGFLHARQHSIDEAMARLSRQSQDAYRSTFFIVALGMALGAPVGLSVIVNIHRSVRRLRRAAREVGEGGFDVKLGDQPNDEFGLLAREFTEMGTRLRNLERERLDANPLTYLPGNLAIHREIEERIVAARPFAHCYVDLDNFKVYNDRYGYEAGNDVIAETGRIIRDVVAARAGSDALVGHIGGDDYVVLTAPDRAEAVAEGIISTFDQRVPAFYSEEDRAEGKLRGEDRFGVQREFPLMSMSIAIVMSSNLTKPTVTSVSQACAALKEHLKNQPGSNFLVDRRSRP